MLDLQIQAQADGGDGGLVVFQLQEIGLYQRLVESARARLAELELEIEGLKMEAEQLAEEAEELAGEVPF